MNIGRITRFKGKITFIVVLGIIVLIVLGGTSPGESSSKVQAAGRGTTVILATSYDVVFNESGLPAANNWTVYLNNTVITSNSSEKSSTNNQIVFSGVTSGSYSYYIKIIPSYKASPFRGNLTVLSGNVYQNISFSRVIYSLSFDESGLPGGTFWSVNISGKTNSSSSSFIKFNEPNGSYAFTVNTTSDYIPSPNSGNITINGKNLTENITFIKTYTVSFSETGLPYRTSAWNVTLGGSLKSSSAPTISFQEINGSYSFIVGIYQGYSASPYKGTINVNGNSVLQSVTFTQVKYSVEFIESGLPSGTKWYVNVTGQPSLSSVSSVMSISLPNGSYSYTIATGNKSYYPSSYSGAFTVNGGSISNSIAFSELNFAVNFTESGLPPGSTWNVTFNGVKQSSSSSSIVFNEPNGTYPFSTGIYQGYSASPYSGTITVNGNQVTQTIAFSQLTYSVFFKESGLASGYWFVNITGQRSSGPLPSAQKTYSISLPNGSYSFSVATGNKLYAPSPSVSLFTVNGSDVTEVITFNEGTFKVTFTESGLPLGSTWNVTFNGTMESSTSPSILFNEPNGTYSYTVGVYQGYSSSPYTGSLKLNGAAIQESITFTLIRYQIMFTESGLPSDSMWNVTLNGILKNSTTDSISFLEPNGSYTYKVGIYQGFSASPYSGIIQVNGVASKESIIFEPLEYSVTFKESGLPLNTSWSVTLSGSTKYSSNDSIVFEEQNGSYSYVVGNVTQFTSSPPSGHLSVSGSAVVISIVFSILVTYNVTFVESGLPPGTMWSVEFNGTVKNSSAGSITFEESNGIYNYTILPVPGYVLTQYSGTVKVDDKNSLIVLPFTEKEYILAFFETGLPPNTSWFVQIGGSTAQSQFNRIIFEEPNGTYEFTIGTANSSWRPSRTTGNVTVSGFNRSLYNSFTLQLYKVEFVVSGATFPWSVTIGNSSYQSNNTGVMIYLPNGSYSYSIHLPNGYKATGSTGSLIISGKEIVVNLAFSKTPSSGYSFYIILTAVIVVIAAVAIVVVFMRRKNGGNKIIWKL